MLKTYWKFLVIGGIVIILLGFYFNVLSLKFFNNLGGQVLSSFVGDSNNFKELDEIILDSSKVGDIQDTSFTSIRQCSFDESKISGARKIIFNEIAWMGSSNSSNDEWFELKNISGGDNGLSGYQILSQDGDMEIVFDEKDKILGNDFYLLERTDDNSTNELADKIYVGSLANYSEGIRLFDNDCNLLDEAIANPGWPAGDNSTKKTMERRNNLSWQTSSVKDGTPKKENSVGEITVSSKNTNDSRLESSSSSVNNLSATSSPSESFSAPVVCSQDNLGSSTNSVLINEVAWAGTNSDKTTKEWIELKNNSGININLNNWQIFNKSSSIKIFFDSSNNLASGGYYLLERVNDDSVPGITADKIFTNSIKNSDETLRLFDGSCRLVDEILASPDWPAGTASPDYRSMERGNDLNWHNYNGSGSSGIMGTPKSENSLPL